MINFKILSIHFLSGWMFGELRGRRGVGLSLLTLCLSASLAGGCSTLPSLVNRTTSTALFNTGITKLGKAISPLVEAHPGKSGIYPVPNARDAFAARALLAQAAERTLDLQYYIWHGDMSGTLLFDAVRAAADRGVRVRLLLDDHGTTGIDTTLAALDSHANIDECGWMSRPIPTRRRLASIDNRNERAE